MRSRLADAGTFDAKLVEHRAGSVEHQRVRQELFGLENPQRPIQLEQLLCRLTYQIAN